VREIFFTIIGKYGKNSTILENSGIVKKKVSIHIWRKNNDSRYFANTTIIAESAICNE